MVNEQTLRDLVKEWQATGPAYRQHVQTVIRNSYRSHYRRMVPPLLDALDFRSNNTRHQPVLRALALVKKYADSKVLYYPSDEEVPLEGVVRDSWQEAVLERDKDGKPRVNRISYEICVLQAPPRATALQGGLGQGRQPLPQPRRGCARGLRRPANRLLCRAATPE